MLENAKRILMLTQYLHTGGMERMIVSLSEEISKQPNFVPVVFVYEFSGSADEMSLAAKLRSAGIKVITTKKSPGFSFGLIRNITRVIREEKIRLIHAHHIGCLMYAVIARLVSRRWPSIIITQHSFIHISENFRYQLYEKIFSRLSDLIVAVSPSVKAGYLKLGFPDDKIKVVENGVQFTDAPVVNAAERMSARDTLLSSADYSPHAAQLRTLQDKFWVLYLARIYPRKGQDHALLSWAKLTPECRKNSALLIVGPRTDEVYASMIESEAGKLENAYVFPGTATPALWLGASDAFLSASEYEGMPLGPIEAAGSGLPTILSNIPGHTFLRESADLFDLSPAECGATAIENLYALQNSSFETARARAVERAEPLQKRFSLRTMAESYRRIYQELTFKNSSKERRE